MANDVVIKVRVDDAASRELDVIKTKAEGAGASLGAVAKIAAGFLAAQAVSQGFAAFKGFIGGSIEAASSLGESLNAVTQIYGESADKILDWGKTNANSFGLSQRVFNQMATPMGAVLKNLGFSTDEAAEKTINLTKRAADMASVFDTDVSDALAAINSALRGEANPIERYGVSVTAAAVAARALADTGKDSAASLTENEKAAARLAIIFEQTNAVAGDFANTSDTLANAQRKAAARTEDLQAQIGAGLLPVMLKITQLKLVLVEVVANKLIPAFERMKPVMTTLANNMDIIMGAFISASTIILVTLIPRLIMLTATTWGLVAALAAQAVAWAVANKGSVVAAIAAGAAVTAFLKLNDAGEEAADGVDAAAASSREMEAAALELAAEMDHTAGSVDGLTGAVTALSFSQQVAALAQESLRYGTGEYERDLPGHIETLKRLWLQEEAVREATEAITERITGKRAAQDAATVSTRGASEASKAAATAEREHVQALAEVERAMAAAQARAQSLAQQFGSLRDAIVQQQGQTTLDLLKLGVSPEDASREAAKGAAASMRLRTDQIVAAISKGTIGIEAGQRALNALRGGTPDPVLLALGLVPGLAAGGIVTRPTMALIGERGPEAIIPLGKASGFGGTTINVNVSGIVGDAAATGRAIADAINAASRQGGPVLLAGAVA